MLRRRRLNDYGTTCSHWAHPQPHRTRILLRFMEKLNDDLNFPQALALAFEALTRFVAGREGDDA